MKFDQRIRKHTTAHGRRFRRELLIRARWRCERCGARPVEEQLHVHHRVPLERGGEVFDFGNCEVLCEPCHRAEHSKIRVPPSETSEWENLRRSDELPSRAADPATSPGYQVAEEGAIADREGGDATASNVL